jgi:hypothetical protein
MKKILILMLLSGFALACFSCTPVLEWQMVGDEVSDGEVHYTDLYVYDDAGTTVPYLTYSEESTEKAYLRMYDGTDWVDVGSQAFSDGKVFDTKVFVYDDNGEPVPYVSYIDRRDMKTTVKMYNGTSWVNVGSAQFSPDTIGNLELYVYDDASTPVPYVAFDDGAEGQQASVMMYNGSNWSYVGDAGFSGSTDNLSIFVYDDGGEPVPYVALQDGGIGHGKSTVMMYNGLSWVNVGNDKFSDGDAGYISLYVYDDGGEPVPYLSFTDESRDGKVTVMSYDGSDWVNVGSPGFSAGTAKFTSLFVYDDSGIPVPYVAYQDWGNDDKASVMMFDGVGWVYVNKPGLSEGTAGYLSLFVYDADGSPVPYVGYKDSGKGYRAVVMKYE